MAKTSFFQADFTGGELSPLVDSRIDAQGYGQGMYLSKNCLPLVQGPVVRRPGTKHNFSGKFDDKKIRLMSFEPDADNPYVIEFGYQYNRFYTPPKYLSNFPSFVQESNTPVSTVTTGTDTLIVATADHGMVTGNRVFLSGIMGDRTDAGTPLEELNGREYLVIKVSSTTYYIRTKTGEKIDSSGMQSYSSGGSMSHIYEISSAYFDSEIGDIRHVSSVDKLYLVHPSHPPRTLSRDEADRFSYEDIDFLDGPYMDPNTTTTTMTPSATTGSAITLTASSATGINNGDGFRDTDVGRLVRLKDNANNWTWGEITAVTSDVAVTFNIRGNDLANTSATLDWRLGLYSATTGYPSVVTFHQDRLWFGGNAEAPTRVDGSQSGAYDIFSPTDPDGTVNDAHGVGAVINSRGNNKVLWISTDDYGLLVGTARAEWLITPTEARGYITPTSIDAKKVRRNGSANVDAIEIDGTTLFVQKAKRKIRALQGNGTIYSSPDISITAEHLSTSGIEQLEYQSDPYPTLWARRFDGLLLGATIQLGDNPYGGWHWHEIGAEADSTPFDYGKGNLTPKNVQNPVESIAVSLDGTGTKEELWVVVRRFNGTEEFRSIEVMAKIFANEDVDEEIYYLDGGYQTVIKDSTSTDFFQVTEQDSQYFLTEVSSLWSLEGQNVRFVYAGQAGPLKTVANGRVTFATSGTDAIRLQDYTEGDVPHILSYGIEYTSHAALMRPEAGAADGGPSLGKTRMVPKAYMNFYRTRNISIGNFELDIYDDYNFEDPNVNLTALKGIDTSGLSTVLDYPTSFAARAYTNNSGDDIYDDAEQRIFIDPFRDKAYHFSIASDPNQFNQYDLNSGVEGTPLVPGAEPNTSHNPYYIPGEGGFYFVTGVSNSEPINRYDVDTGNITVWGDESSAVSNTLTSFALSFHFAHTWAPKSDGSRQYFLFCHGTTLTGQGPFGILKVPQMEYVAGLGLTSSGIFGTHNNNNFCRGHSGFDSAGRGYGDIYVPSSDGSINRVRIYSNARYKSGFGTTGVEFREVFTTGGEPMSIVPDETDGHLLVFISDTPDRVEKRNVETGEIMWSTDLGTNGVSSTSFRQQMATCQCGNGYFAFITDDDAHLVIINTLTGAITTDTAISGITTSSSAWTSLTDKGLLLIREGTSLYTIRVPRGIVSEVELANYYNAQLSTGVYEIEIPSDNDKDGRISWKNNGPYPWNILSVTGSIITHDGG